MEILGISCYFHDAAAALVRDGQPIAAAEEERFSRRKHDYGFPQHAIDFCLKAGGIPGAALDYVVFFEKPFVKFERLLLSCLQTFPRSRRLFQEAMIGWLADKVWIRNLIRTRLGVSASRILFSEHHLSHAAGAFLCSRFDEAALLRPDPPARRSWPRSPAVSGTAGSSVGSRGRFEWGPRALGHRSILALAGPR